MIKNALLTDLIHPIIYGSILALYLAMGTGAVGAENPDAVAPTYQTGIIDATGTTHTPPPATAPLAGYETAPDTAPEADPYAPAPGAPKRPRTTSLSGDDPNAVAPSVETGVVGDPR